MLARSDKPVFEAEKEWEKVGQVPNVVFVEGLVSEPTRWMLYYGGADKYVGVVSTQLKYSEVQSWQPVSVQNSSRMLGTGISDPLFARQRALH